MKKQFFLGAIVWITALTFSFVSCNSTGESAGENAAEAPAKTEAEAPKPAPGKRGLQVGQTAPDFELQNVDGEMVSLADFPEAKGYIVTFTCNTCPFSQVYEDRLIALHNEFAPKGYPVLAIQPNDPEIKPGDSFENMKQRAAEKTFPFPYLMDDGTATAAYGATRTPEIYLLDKDLTLRYTGAIDDNAQEPESVQVKYVEKAIEALESGQAPEPSLVKAVGCTIKPRTPKQS